MRIIVVLGLVLLVGFLASSCSSLSPFLDAHFNDAERPREGATNKRVPLPPTIKDFEAESAGQ